MSESEIQALPEPEFVQMLTQHQGPVLAYIRSLMPGQPDTQDVLQAVNMTLWEKRETFAAGTNFKAWAFTVARYQVMSQRARVKRRGWMVFDENLAEKFAEELEVDDNTEEALGALDVCLSKLRSKDLELVKIRYTSDQNLDEYATTLGRSAGTLKARLFKIRAVLRRCIETQIKNQEVSV